MLERVEHSLAPIYDKDSKVLILGSMPSPKSRAMGFYYGHPQNRFWKVMESLFDCHLETIAEKKLFLASHHIALFDVLASCDIAGASDSSIRNAVPNDLAPIFNVADIQAVFTTGQKAHQLYHRYLEKQTKMPDIVLPSTSPANAKTSLAALVEAYQCMVDVLEK